MKNHRSGIEKTRSCFALLGVLLAGAQTATAGSITINNGDFQQDTLTLDLLPTAYVRPGTPTNWLSTGSVGTGEFLTGRGTTTLQTVFDVNLPNWNGVIFPQGRTYTSQIAQLNSGSLFLAPTAIAADTRYAVTAQILNRHDEPGFTNSNFTFFAGTLANTIKTISIAAPDEGWFLDQVFTITAAELNGYAGQQLGISFNQVSNGALQFDNVSMISTHTPPPPPPPPPPAPVPGPGAAVFLMGLLMIVTARVKKLKR